MGYPLSAGDVINRWDDAVTSERAPLVVVEPLTAYLDERELGSGPLRISPLGEGHSNVTLLVERGDERLVLRRPPRGTVARSAHDMMREAAMLRALEGSGVPIPRVIDACASPDVIGTPFYLMNLIEGYSISHEPPIGFDARRDGAKVSSELVSTLVAIHDVDLEVAGTAARGAGYLSRQLRRFLDLWEVNRTRDIPEVPVVARWLQANLPARSDVTIVHGDYRLGNVLYVGSPPRIAAVLDWEMATVGDPLADLGYLIAMWNEPSDPQWTFDLSPETRAEGFHGRSELVARYADLSGRDIDRIDFYTTLALWKLVVIMEGNYKRALAGATDDPFLHQSGAGVLEIAARAHLIGPDGGSLVG